MENDFKTATAAANEARSNFERAKQQFTEEEGRLADARRAAEKARLACRKADPSSSGFDRVVLERAHADARVDAFSQRVADAGSAVEAAATKARQASIAADEAELLEIKARIDEEDSGILKLILEAHLGSKERLKRIRQLGERGDTLEQAIAVAKGENLTATWRWPNLIRSLFGIVADRVPYEAVLGHLEHAALGDENHLANCRKEKLRAQVLAAVQAKKP